MKEKMLEALGYRFDYDPNVLKKFQKILDVRFDEDAEISKQFKAFLADHKKAMSLLHDDEFSKEFKRLNLMSLKERLKFIEENNVDETVVIAYMKLLVKAIESSSLCAGNTSTELELSEETMLKYLLDAATFNEDLNAFEGISNTNLRLVLQTWLLYPQFLKNADELGELLDCLALTSFRL